MSYELRAMSYNALEPKLMVYKPVLLAEYLS